MSIGRNYETDNEEKSRTHNNKQPKKIQTYLIASILVLSCFSFITITMFKSSSRRTCSIKNCNNTIRDGVTLHHLPKDINRRDLWLHEILKHQNEIHSGSFICSTHFFPYDYHLFTFCTKTRRLKYSAVPHFKLVSS